MFVADAGQTVSAENLSALARASGRYIVRMPIYRGGEVARGGAERSGAEIECLNETNGGSHSKRMCECGHRPCRLPEQGRKPAQALQVALTRSDLDTQRRERGLYELAPRKSEHAFDQWHAEQRTAFSKCN